jgi:hypothetical protein
MLLGTGSLSSPPLKSWTARTTSATPMPSVPRVAAMIVRRREASGWPGVPLRPAARAPAAALPAAVAGTRRGAGRALGGVLEAAPVAAVAAARAGGAAGAGGVTGGGLAPGRIVVGWSSVAGAPAPAFGPAAPDGGCVPGPG